jgi:hypothetical protein
MKINIHKYLKYLIIIIVIIIFFCVYKFIYVEYAAVPKLTLNGNKITIIEVNKEYKEQGAKAISNNKDISNSIITTGSVDTSKVGEYKITYTVQNNKKKNKRTIERIVKVVDKIKPIISLIGEYSISIYLNQIYREQGAKATDNYDGDITTSIKINNKIDNTKIGKYEVIYEPEDEYVQ